MESLPHEIVLNILSRLPIPSLVQSKLVCRPWRSLIRSLIHDPSFILQSNHPIQSQLYLGDFSSQNDGNYNMVTMKLPMPPLSRFTLASSCNGLLCLLDYHRSFEPCIYNPFTANFLELPHLTRHHNFQVLGFGFHPITKEYKLVEISYTIYTCGGSFGRLDPSPFKSDVHILTLGSSTWRHLGTVPYHVHSQQKSQARINGKLLHWVSWMKNRRSTIIISFDMETEKFHEIPLPDCCSSSNKPTEGFDQVVVIRGCLSAVRYGNDSEELEIWVMKEYGVKESWSKEFSIGAYVPKILLERDESEFLIYSRSYLHRKQTRVMCMLRSGELLLEYRNKALVVYDPHCKTFKDVQLTFEGIPTFFIVDVHVANLNWIDTLVDMAEN
ncbi:hypothetical protein COLO4_20026 [Corchorus olitorius]|uniref:F-box domain-containing protein n=1 Tax=Corchorus olitorius TaxID=93759 RepID=A0A1R3J282_9ROSI|nr:hypothetical protein COLO4_20026 [Corchorus olitorius]